MPRIATGRTTHEHDGELVVFLIGMTVNQPLRPDRWLPVFGAMPAMLRELSAAPASGLLGFRTLVGLRGPTVVQYWSSVEALHGYAGDPGAAHRPAWAAFNQRARRAPGAVGIWHETYVVERSESVYVSTPVMGLAAATRSVPVARRGESAAARLALGRRSAR